MKADRTVKELRATQKALEKELETMREREKQIRKDQDTLHRLLKGDEKKRIQKQRDTRGNLESRKVKWCKENLKVGDIVRFKSGRWASARRIDEIDLKREDLIGTEVNLRDGEWKRGQYITRNGMKTIAEWFNPEIDDWIQVSKLC